MGSLENAYQRKLKKKLKERYPGCYVLKNDPTMTQGIPDLTILYEDKWACLEVKKNEKEMISGKRPNQEFRVKELNEMSYAAFICPENEEDILHELDDKFGVER